MCKKLNKQRQTKSVLLTNILRLCLSLKFDATNKDKHKQTKKSDFVCQQKPLY